MRTGIKAWCHCYGSLGISVEEDVYGCLVAKVGGLQQVLLGTQHSLPLSVFSAQDQRGQTLETTPRLPLTAGLWISFSSANETWVCRQMGGGNCCSQAMMVAADVQALVGMRSYTDWPPLRLQI